MLGRFRPSFAMSCLIATITFTQVSFGQNSETSRPANGKAGTSVGAMRAGAPKPTGKKAPTKVPFQNKSESSGILHQFKSFTQDVFGENESPQDKPNALEARNRRPFEPAARRTQQRNQIAAERGMPTPPPIDPPSLSSSQALPPIVSKSTEDASRKGVDDEFEAKSPSISASEKSSTRRQSAQATPNTMTTNTSKSKPNDDSAPIPYNGIETPTQFGPEASPESGEDEFRVKRRPIPSASLPVSTPTREPAPIEEKPFNLRSENSNSGSPLQLPPIRSDLAPDRPSSNALIHSSLPRVDVTLEGPESLQINHPTPFQVVAYNRDQLPLNGLIVRLGIPKTIQISPAPNTEPAYTLETEEDGSTSLLWQVESLNAGQTQTLSFGVNASKPEHFAVDLEWTALPLTGQANVQVQQPQLQLAIEGPSEVTYGKPEMYRLRLKNPGNADVKEVAVSLRAEAEEGNSTVIGDLAAGSERVIEVELTFQQPGPITIAAEAKSEIAGIQSNNQIQIVVQQAALEARWNSPAQHYQGSVESYELTIQNVSSMHAKQVECQIVLPAGCSAVSIPEGFRLKGQELTWRVDQILGNSSATYVLQLDMSETGMLPLRFQCEGAAGASAKAEATAKVEAIADLKLTVVDPVAPAPIGKPVTYELVIANRGTKPATGVRIVAQFSNGIEPTQVAGHQHKIIPGQVLFDPIQTIGAGQERVIRITALASQSGSHRFRAEVTSDDSETQLIHEESTKYLATGRVEGQPEKVRR